MLTIAPSMPPHAFRKFSALALALAHISACLHLLTISCDRFRVIVPTTFLSATRADLDQKVEKCRRCFLRHLKRLGLPPWLRQESQKRLLQRPRRAAYGTHSQPAGARIIRHWSLLKAACSTARMRERPRASHSSTRLRRKPRLLLKRDGRSTERWWGV